MRLVCGVLGSKVELPVSFEVFGRRDVTDKKYTREEHQPDVKKSQHCMSCQPFLVMARVEFTGGTTNTTNILNNIS